MYPVFIVGCGGVGQGVAKEWIKRGTRVSALTHTIPSANHLTELGITPVMGDLDVADTLADLQLSGQWVYYFAPPVSTGTVDTRMQTFIGRLGLLKEPPLGIVYISTSGVYGDCQGAWVDEEAPLAPVTDRSKRRVDAEQRLRTWGSESGVAVIVLRVGGIYGPGRLPLKRLQKSEPVLEPAESPYSNRIHIDDLVTVSLAAIERGEGDRAYNVCDDAPTTMSDYFFAVAAAAGLPRPPTVNRQQAAAVLSSGMLSYLNESRRMVNRRLHEELKVTLRYPDLVSGLKKL
jgi:nucleoside-diphosphate-sugar epimerase